MAVLDFNTAATLSELEAQQRSRSTVDVEDIKARLNANPRAFVDWLFSGRAFCTKREARIGDIHGTPGASLSISLSGPNVGQWNDHSTRDDGDLIGLYMAHMGYAQGRNFQLALKEIASEFLGDPVKVDRSAATPTATWRIAEKKEKLGDKPRADMLELGVPVATHRYLDQHGNMLASVVRYEPDGTRENKTYRPYCFKVKDGIRKWVMGAPDLRPLFRIPDIVTEPVVVLVEGENSAQALADLGIPATSAMQGAYSPVEKTDWSPLNGKKVVVWPDNDDPGFTYGRKAAEHLSAIGCEVLLVNIPVGVRPKWDAADCVAEGGDPHRIIAEAVSLVATARSRIRIVDIDELETLPPPAWLIDGILTVNGLSVLWGASGALKSFAAVDIGLCIATGLPWHGKTVQQGLVVYIAAEGSYGLAKRAVGWRRSRGKDGPKPKFKLVPHSVSLPTPDDTNALIGAIGALDEKPLLIVIDTMARTFGAGDENKQADMNAYVGAADRLREATGANVMIVHHSGVGEAKRERGSNVLRGAADTVIQVKRDGDRIELVNAAPEGKQKDAEEFATVCLRTQKITYEQSGVEHTTLILNLDEGAPVAEAAGEPQAEPQRRATPIKFGKNENLLLNALRQAERPMGFTSLCALVGGNKGTASRALANLVADGMATVETGETGTARLWIAVKCS